MHLGNQWQEAAKFCPHIFYLQFFIPRSTGERKKADKSSFFYLTTFFLWPPWYRNSCTFLFLLRCCSRCSLCRHSFFYFSFFSNGQDKVGKARCANLRKEPIYKKGLQTIVFCTWPFWSFWGQFCAVALATHSRRHVCLVCSCASFAHPISPLLFCLKTDKLEFAGVWEFLGFFFFLCCFFCSALYFGKGEKVNLRARRGEGHWGDRVSNEGLYNMLALPVYAD